MRYQENSKNIEFQYAFAFSKSGIVEIIKINGNYSGMGKITLDSMNVVDLKQFTQQNIPEFPIGLKLELTISFDEKEFLSGIDGIVWATYDLRQAEIIQSALVAQQINLEINKIFVDGQELCLLKILNKQDVDDTIDFIWRSGSGLRLTPDWDYADGESNKSFEQWLSGQ